MTSLERLRLATALCHAVDGAELRLTTDGGERIIVSHHPAADIDPCSLRSVVVASARPQHPDFSHRITDIAIGGALIDCGGGVYSRVVRGAEQRWIASFLHVDRVAAMLEEVGPGNALDASLKPDGDLGVTLLAITSIGEHSESVLDTAATGAAAACFVEELCDSMAGVGPTGG
jgi:hypothetical protein